MLDLALSILGGVLIVLGLVDVFLTVLYYDDMGFLSNRLYRWSWETTRRGTALLPKGMCSMGRSLGGPLMVLATPLMWVGLELVGFALLFFVGLGEGNFVFGPQLEPDWLLAIYYSVVTVATLGYGDITPIVPSYQMLAALGTLIGFALFSLATTYILGVYRVLGRMNILEMGLYHQTEDSEEPLSALECYFPGGEAHSLGPLLRDFHQGIEAYYNGIRRYPVVYFFHSRKPYRSAPFAFRMIGHMAAGLRWGLPAEHPATREPALYPLVSGFVLTTNLIKGRLAIQDNEAPPETVSFSVFSEALSGEKEPEDHWLGRFMKVERFMRRLACLEQSPEPKEAYARYEQWLPLAHHTDNFVKLLAEDLGYKPEDLRNHPGQQLANYE